MTPPDGVTPDPDAPFEATRLIVVIGIFWPLAAIAVAIRLYTRATIAGSVGRDDCMDAMNNHRNYNQQLD